MLAARLEMKPDRVYHHLDQLEQGGLIEIADYGRLPRDKVERIYAPAVVEHPDDDGAWTTVLWTTIDRQDRRTARAPRTPSRKRGPRTSVR
jgi:DNA-binding transcriptional ArsR family regulator